MDAAHSILRVRPESTLDKSGIAELAKVVDPQIEAGGDFAEHLASHFITAEIRSSPGDQIEAARHWIIGDE